MSDRTETLLFRVDANREIGTGHLMRCLALAQAWRLRGGRVVFVTRPLAEALRQRLNDERIEHQVIDDAAHPIVDAATAARCARVEHAEWVVIDGYHFDAAYHAELVSGTPHVLAFDDDGRTRRYVVDVVLNQNAHAGERMYADRAAHTRLLLGLDYVVLRREFLDGERPRRDFDQPARRILVTLGGADRHNHSLRVLRALNSLARPLDVTLLIGGNNPHRAAIEAEIDRLSYLSIRIEVATPNMPAMLNWADVAIAAGGTTVWECAYLGTPALVGSTSAIEQAGLDGLLSCGLFDVLGRYADLSETELAARIEALLVDPQRRRMLSERGAQRIDGRGVERVIECLSQSETRGGKTEGASCR